MYRVLKNFHTAHRRFAAGDEVGVDDLAGPVPVERWQRLGYIGPAVSAGPAQRPPMAMKAIVEDGAADASVPAEK